MWNTSRLQEQHAFGLANLSNRCYGFLIASKLENRYKLVLQATVVESVGCCQTGIQNFFCCMCVRKLPS